MYQRIRDILQFHKNMCEQGETLSYAGAPIAGCIVGLSIGFWFGLLSGAGWAAIGLVVGGIAGLLIGDLRYILCDLSEQLADENQLAGQLAHVRKAIKQTREAVLDYVADKDGLCQQLDQLQRRVEAIDEARTKSISQWLCQGEQERLELSQTLVLIAIEAGRLSSHQRSVVVIGPVVTASADWRDAEAVNQAFRENMARWEQLCAEIETAYARG